MTAQPTPYAISQALGGGQGLPGGQSQLASLLAAITGQQPSTSSKSKTKGATAKAKSSGSKSSSSKSGSSKSKTKKSSTPDYGKNAGKTDVNYNLNPIAYNETAPLAQQIQAALGLPSSGTPTQSQYASAAAPSLSQYLGQLSQGLSAMGANAQGGGGGGLAAALQSGLSQEGQAESEMPAALQEAASSIGSAGLLSDLLKAAQYQAIYKQAAYGNPGTSDAALAQLYNTVVNQGGSLTSGLTGASASTPASLQVSPQSVNANPGTQSSTSSTPSNVFG